MKFLQELIENADSIKTKKVWAAMVYGGRGGDHLSMEQLDFPINVTPEQFHQLAEDNDELYEVMPNNTDDDEVAKMIKAVAAGKVYSNWNTGGDGAYAIAPKKQDAELAVYRELHNN